MSSVGAGILEKLIEGLIDKELYKLVGISPLRKELRKRRVYYPGFVLPGNGCKVRSV